MPTRTSLTRSTPPALLLAVLALAGMGASFMQTIVVPIQPLLPELLNASPSDAAWVITSTLVAGTVCTPIAGRLGDMYGKRRIAMALLLLQVAGGFLAALSYSLIPMVIARVLQGMAAGVIPLGIAILRDTLPPQRLGSAIALVSATLGVGGALGLPLSAGVAEAFDWHVLFWCAAGIALLCFALFALFVPVSTLRSPGRIDFGGVAGLAIALVAILVPITRGGEWGWNAPVTLIPLITGVVVLLAWGIYELRVPRSPLVDLRVAARRPVLLTNLASAAMGFALFSSNIVFPQLLQLPVETGIGLGRSLLDAGIALAPAGIAMMLLSPLAGRLEHRYGPKPLFIAGAGVIASSYAISLVLRSDLWHIIAINTLIGVGVGLGYAAMPALIMRAVPATETGSANGVNTLMRSMGSSIASAVAGAALALSTIDYGSFSGPSESGFVLTLALGLGAALLCIAVAIFIPTRSTEEHAALPEDAL